MKLIQSGFYFVLILGNFNEKSKSPWNEDITYKEGLQINIITTADSLNN